MPSTATRKVKSKSPKRAVRKSSAEKKAAKKDLSASYNEFKEFEGRQYSGMKIGRSHKWNYDKGEWRETKITPDLWEISYAVTKRRAGHAPKGSGVPVGTGYHWYIVAHQNVTKLNANDYTTSLSGLKYKLAHKRADKETWSATPKTQRKHLVAFLKDMIAQLEQEAIPLEFDYKQKRYAGEALPLKDSCHDGVCDELDIILNNDHLGIIRSSEKGWKMKYVKDQKLVDMIGQEIMLWYE
ncbi:MAG: hypothetical protein J7497_13990 [Chitinophagaceae bacterium]|nr:hypothetical protein [Chitinophagaceae bacterium]